jgi:hypothetical protein
MRSLLLYNKEEHNQRTTEERKAEKRALRSFVTKQRYKIYRVRLKSNVKLTPVVLMTMAT